jgi:hypothetical protein
MEDFNDRSSHPRLASLLRLVPRLASCASVVGTACESPAHREVAQGARDVRRAESETRQLNSFEAQQSSRCNQQPRKQQTMSLIPVGIWPCTVFGASFGENDKGVGRVQINVRIDEGPAAGRMCTYEDDVSAKSAPYVGRSCRAVGWKSTSLAGLKDDCEAWIAATGGKSTVEIKHLEIKTGKRAGQVWDKPNSIGRGAKPLADAKPSTLADADDAMRRAMAEDNADSSDDSIPF